MSRLGKLRAEQRVDLALPLDRLRMQVLHLRVEALDVAERRRHLCTWQG